MSLFPRIARPCPYIDRLDDVIDERHCRMCRREVHDLTDLDDTARAAFLAACGGDACVSYVAMVRPAVAAALVAASAAAFVAPEAAAAHRHKAKVAAVSPPPMVPVMLAGAPVLVPVDPPASSPTPSGSPEPAVSK